MIGTVHNKLNLFRIIKNVLNFSLEATYKNYISDFNASYEKLINSDEVKITTLF